MESEIDFCQALQNAWQARVNTPEFLIMACIKFRIEAWGGIVLIKFSNDVTPNLSPVTQIENQTEDDNLSSQTQIADQDYWADHIFL